MSSEKPGVLFRSRGNGLLKTPTRGGVDHLINADVNVRGVVPRAPHDTLRVGLGPKHEGSGHSVDMSKAAPISCPCCSQSVAVPTLEMAIYHYGLTPTEARILGAIWRGKGLPVMADRIFDAMYADDPNGGPSQTRMYAAFKVALSHLRDRLEGSGISIVNVGYRRGYRLVVGAY